MKQKVLGEIGLQSCDSAPSSTTVAREKAAQAVKILIIDDSKIMQAGMKRALVKAGHDVIVAVEGEQGFILARQALPDLILLDMMLPVMSGTEVLAALKLEPATREIPVFVLTGLSQKNENTLLKAGAAKYFEKSADFLEHNFAVLVEAIGCDDRDGRRDRSR